MRSHSSRIVKSAFLGASVVLTIAWSFSAEGGRVEQAVKKVVHRIDRFARSSGRESQVAVVYRPTVVSAGAEGEAIRDLLVNQLAKVINGRSGFIFYQDPDSAERNLREVFRLIDVAKNIADPLAQDEAISELRRAIGRTRFRYFVDTRIEGGQDYLTISGEVFSATGGTVFRTSETIQLSIAEAESSLVEGAGVYLLQRDQGLDLSLQANNALGRSDFKEDSSVVGAVLKIRSANAWAEFAALQGESQDRDVGDFDYSTLELSFDSQFSLWEGRWAGVFLGLGARDFEEQYRDRFSSDPEIAIGTRSYDAGTGLYFGSINNGLLVGVWYDTFKTEDRSSSRYFSDGSGDLYDGDDFFGGLIFRRTSLDWEAEIRLLAKQGSVEGVSASSFDGLRTDFNSYGTRVEVDRRWRRIGLGIFGGTQRVEYQDLEGQYLRKVRNIESSWVGLRLSYRFGV